MDSDPGSRKERCLVIGGAGMLGYEIVLQLLQLGKSVTVLDLQPVADDRITSLTGDIRDFGAVSAACKGAETVFQTAAAVWDPCLPKRTYDEVNITGNQNVIRACREHGVRKLVYTSTMDVIVDGAKPVIFADETAPTVRSPKDPYSRSKIIAEQLVLEADSNDLSVCVLRPAGMYGPRDRYHVPNILKAARSGLNIRLGDGSAKFSHVYSENVAHAHILASEALKPGSVAAGQCYFITDFEPENFFDFMTPFLKGLGYPAATISLPYGLAYGLAAVSEIVNPRSAFNRFAVIQTCVDHTFSHAKAARDLGYKPIVSRNEAFEKTLAWFRSHPGP